MNRLLSVNDVERPSAPNDVWDVYRHQTWHSTIWGLISDFVDDDVKKAFLAHPPEYLVGDDLSWLDELVLQVHGREMDSKHELAERLQGHYRAIRACHGTSLPNVTILYEQGLRPLVIEDYQEEARSLFLGGQFPELSEENLLAAMESVGPATREGHIYFEANERFLIDHCGHYMLYGSEYLTALAANLGGNQDYRRTLKGRYVPTLLVCDVPMRLLHPGTVAEFAGIALESVFNELLEGLVYAPDKWRGLAFSIRTPLKASGILGHYHPAIPRDPLR